MQPHDTTPPEKWRPVVGYEGWYSVSDQGRIRRERGGPGVRAGRILKPVLITQYHYVALSRDGVRRLMRIHRLVAAAFLGPCPAGEQVNHLNGIPTDNRTLNLEYCTPRENKQHASRLGLVAVGARNGAHTRPDRVARGERNGRARLTSIQVIEVRTLYATGLVTQTAIARRFGVGKLAISRIVRGRSWAHQTTP